MSQLVPAKFEIEEAKSKYPETLIQDHGRLWITYWDGRTRTALHALFLSGLYRVSATGVPHVSGLHTSEEPPDLHFKYGEQNVASLWVHYICGRVVVYNHLAGLETPQSIVEDTKFPT